MPPLFKPRVYKDSNGRWHSSTNFTQHETFEDALRVVREYYAVRNSHHPAVVRYRRIKGKIVLVTERQHNAFADAVRN